MINRVLFVIGSMQRGGSEHQLLLLCEGLRKEGVEAKILLLRHQGSRLREAEEKGLILNSFDIPKAKELFRLSGWKKLYKASKDFRTILRNYNPQVIHAWLFWSHVWVWLHHFSLRNQVFVISRRQVKPDRPPSKFLDDIDGRVSKYATTCIANSPSVARAAIKSSSGRYLKGNIHVAYNAIPDIYEDMQNSQEVSEVVSTLPDQYICCVANLLPVKGHLDLIDAMSQVSKQYPKIKLVLVGRDDGYGTVLKDKCKELEIEKHVIFAGEQTNVYPIIKDALFCVLPSHDEGLPNALLEYLKCGKASIATAVGGVPDILNHEKNGLLVEPKNVEALVQRMIQLIKNESMRTNLERRALRFADTRFSVAHMTKRHLAIYNRYYDD